MHTRTLAQLAEDLAAKRLSSVELTRHHLDRIASLGDALNAFITVTRDQALAEAERAEEDTPKPGGLFGA